MARTSRTTKVLALLLGLSVVGAACGDSGNKSSSTSAAAGTTAASGTTAAGGATTAAPETTAAAGKTGGTITLGAEQWPECINPITQCSNSSWMHWAVDEHVLPRLMELDKDGNFVPSPVLAGEPTLSGDGTGSGTGPFSVTYKISPDAVWDDGSPITSADVEFSFQAQMKTTGAVSTAGYDQIDRVDTTDPKTAVIVFKKPYADWQDIEGGNSNYLLKKAAFSGVDLKDEMATAIPFSGQPFKLESFSKDQAVLVPNDKFWDASRKPKVDKVVVVPLADQDTELNALLAGEVDAIYPQPSPGITDKLNKSGIKYQFGAGTTYEGIWLTQKSTKNPKSPLADKAVREALFFAINRQEILDKVIHPSFPDTQMLNCGGWVPTVGKWCNQNDFADVKYDPAKVDSILTGDGWAKGSDGIYAKNGQKLQLTWQTVAGNKRRESIQALIIPELKALGIEVTADNSDADTLFQTRLPNLDTEMAIYAQTASPDPSVTSIFACENIPSAANNNTGQNDVAWCNQQATDLMHKSDATPDPTARADLIHQIGALIRSDAVWLPFYQLPLITAWNSDKLAGPVGSYTSAPNGGFENIWAWSLA